MIGEKGRKEGLRVFRIGLVAIVLSAIATATFLPPVCFSGEPGQIASRTITGRLSARNGFSWQYGYGIGFINGKVLVEVRINLVPSGSVTVSDIVRVVPVWKSAIAEIWSERFALVTGGGGRYPIKIDVAFEGPRSHHDVIVRTGSGRSDALNWSITDTPSLIAHEVGHLLGLFDEYPGGATASPDEIIDPASIMTSSPSPGVAYERHYHRFREWFIAETGIWEVDIREGYTGNSKPLPAK